MNHGLGSGLACSAIGPCSPLIMNAIRQEQTKGASNARNRPGIAAVHELQAADEGEGHREDGENAVVDAARDGAHGNSDGDHAEAQARQVHAVGAVRPAVQAFLHSAKKGRM